MYNYSLPETLTREIDDLEELIAKYKNGEISFGELKAHRVPFGVYEQREPDTFMARVRCAAGCVTPGELEKISELAARYTSSPLHLTTRQELQIHYVKLDDVIPIIRELAKIGLASRGGGGNTVRNIIAPPDAGININEVFDVTPYAIALTTRMIAEEDSWTLPRKFKIAFSSSAADEAYATIADIGFIAAMKNGVRGFRVYAAGGLGAKPDVAKLLFDFIPEKEVYNVTKAVKTLFWKYGNRKNKHAARLRFLYAMLGAEEFEKRFTEEYEKIKKENHPPLELGNIENAFTKPDILPEKPRDEKDFSVWQKRFVRPQKQKDLFSVLVPVELGFIENEKASSLARFFKKFGDNVLRLTKEQNFLVRNIPATHLANVYNFLKESEPNFNRPVIYDKLISCAGASTCQLGICLSRPAARALMRMFAKSSLDLDALEDIRINISGCPNSCGHHPAASLGFFGKAARKGTRLYPAYNVVAGAVLRDGETALAETVGEVSAKDLPKLVNDFLGLYLEKKARGEAAGYDEYMRERGKSDLKKICEKYGEVPFFEQDKNYYFDWESEKVFSLEGRGAGECSAGIFDLIELDLENVNKKLAELSALRGAAEREKAEKLRELIFYSSRMLLIARGIEPKTQEEVYDNFLKHFVETGLVDASFSGLISAARNEEYETIPEKEKEAEGLAKRVKYLYEIMDNSFQFVEKGVSGVSSRGPDKVKAPQEEDNKYKVNAVKDFRGVACPMNFVKTKMELARLKQGEVLEVWLDEGEAIRNVPGSVKGEGHEILKQKKNGDYWTVVIRKK